MLVPKSQTMTGYKLNKKRKRLEKEKNIEKMKNHCHFKSCLLTTYLEVEFDNFNGTICDNGERFKILAAAIKKST